MNKPYIISFTCSDSWLEFNGFVDDCNKDEKRVLKLKLQGYNGKEIAIKMKCSTSKINGCMQSIKEKAKLKEIVSLQ